MTTKTEKKQMETKDEKKCVQSKAKECKSTDSSKKSDKKCNKETDCKSAKK